MSELRRFNDECLAAHNGLRKAHKVDSLQYDESLAIAAQAYAEKLAKMKKLEHSQDSERPNMGENLALSNKPFPNYKFSGRGVSASWYSEIKDYDFSKEEQKSGNPATGHFTQVIWKGSKKAGFGRAQDNDHTWYVVGRYSPNGNFLREFKNNVPICSYSKWEDIPVLLDYLEELRTWEFTKARKHILDVWSSETVTSIKNGITSHTITEKFTSTIYGSYTGTETFSEDPTDLPRPDYCDENEYFNDNDYDPENNRYDSPDDNLMEFEEESFENSVLRQHNFYRKNHNVGLLKVDKKLSEFAQDWAEEIAEKNKTEFSGYRFNDCEIGENISVKVDRMNERSGERLVDTWYQEEKMFSYNKEPTNFKKVGHFTQLVWKESNKIGIGCAKSKSGKHYIVCFYYPPGNVKNSFTKNVLPSSKF